MVYDSMMLFDCVKPISIREVDELRYDLLLFSSRSWSGRVSDGRFFVNAFIHETVVSLENSLDLFEKGYFDCAFYCLRSSIELSTAVIFLHDVSQEERQDSYVSWVTKAKFPFRSTLVSYLSEDGMYYSDVKNNLNHVFGKDKLIDRTNHDLNKHVHKQGYGEFYVIRSNSSFSSEYDNGELADEFVRLFKDTVRIVALMRLIIDPFPVLLLDPEVNYRCPEMEEPYDVQFVFKYLSDEDIECYKKTRIYQEAYDSVIQREKCSAEIIDIKRYWIYNHRAESIIRKQFYLLSSKERWLAELLFSFPIILKVSEGGFILAHTEVPIYNWDATGFYELCRNGETNVPYKGRYISSFIYSINGHIRKINLDHERPFEENELIRITELVNMLCNNEFVEG